MSSLSSCLKVTSTWLSWEQVFDVSFIGQSRNCKKGECSAPGLVIVGIATTSGPEGAVRGSSVATWQELWPLDEETRGINTTASLTSFLPTSCHCSQWPHPTDPPSLSFLAQSRVEKGEWMWWYIAQGLYLFLIQNVPSQPNTSNPKWTTISRHLSLGFKNHLERS